MEASTEPEVPDLPAITPHGFGQKWPLMPLSRTRTRTRSRMGKLARARGQDESGDDESSSDDGDGSGDDNDNVPTTEHQDDSGEELMALEEMDNVSHVELGRRLQRLLTGLSKRTGRSCS